MTTKNSPAKAIIDVIPTDVVRILIGNIQKFRNCGLTGEIRKGLDQTLKQETNKKFNDYQGIILISENQQERYNYQIGKFVPQFTETYGTNDPLRQLENRLPDYFSKKLTDYGRFDELDKSKYLHLIVPGYEQIFKEAEENNKIIETKFPIEKINFLKGDPLNTIINQMLKDNPCFIEIFNISTEYQQKYLQQTI